MSTPIDSLPAFCKARILILGVGNVLFGDDGFGPEVVKYLHEHHRVPDDSYVEDAGTGVRKLLFTLSLSEALPGEIVVVDAVDGGRSDWQVGEIPLEDLPEAKLDDFSLHHAPTSNLLRDLRDQRHVKVTILGCDVGEVPQLIRPGLTGGARQAVVEAGKLLAARFAFPPVW